MRNARDKSSEVGKLSRAFSRSVESSDWLFVCLQISCLKSGDYHMDFSRSVSERLAWIGSPTTPNLSPDLGLVIPFFTPPSGQGLVIPFFFRVFYPAVRTGSSNTHFFRGFFFGGHLPQTSGFRSAKQILVVSFATKARAFILSDRNIFYSPQGGGGEGRTMAGSNAPGAFLVFFWWSLAPDLWFSLGQTNTRRLFRYKGKGFYLE